MSMEQVVFDVMKADAKQAFADLSWVQPVTPQELDLDASDPATQFDAIGHELFAQFDGAGLTKRMNPMVVEHGFTVAARGVGRCTIGYLEYCDEAAVTPANGELNDALLDARTIRFFTFLASMASPKNREYEVWLGLRQHRALDETEFLYNPTEHHFAPNPFTLGVAQDEAAKAAVRNGLSTSPTDEEPRICPARAFVPLTWGITVAASQQAGLLDVQARTSSLPLDLNRI